MERNAASGVQRGVGIANGAITVEVEVEVGFKGESSRGVGIKQAPAADTLPTAVELPGMEFVCFGVFPKEGVLAINGGCSKSLPTSVDAFMDLLAARGDGDGAATINGNGVFARARCLLECDRTCSI